MDTTLALTPSPIMEMAALAPRVEELIKASRAESTQRIYRSDWKEFSTWCDAHALMALPAAPTTVAAYLASLVDTGRRACTINRKVSAIRFAHKVASVENPCAHPLVEATASGIRRQIGVAQHGKAPARTEDIKLMVASLPENLHGLRDRALLLLGFAGAMRRSELVALDIRDITESSEGLRVVIRRSKTDQEGAGIIKGIPVGRHPETCPVRALNAWLVAAGITSGAVFRKVNRHGRLGAMRLTAQSVAIVVKRVATAVGLDPDRFSGHSLRAGLATSAAAAGVDMRFIMAQGAWASERMVRRYIRDGNLFRENAAAQVGL